MKIGLVLPSAPAYSETFFTAKIKGLQSSGHEVVLFVNKTKENNPFQSITKTTVSLSGNSILTFSNIFFALIGSLLFHFKTSRALYYLNRKDKMSIVDSLKSIVVNSHILSERLDWLHFGFGTMVLDRENVAQAIGAKMAVSFRGFDHYVYPIKNENCYQLLFSKVVKYHVLSDGMKQSLIQNGVPSDSIFKITPAIDINLFSSEEKRESGSVLQLMTIARLHWIKGLEYTLQALALLKEKGVVFQYTIIGDGLEKERLQFAIHQLGLTNCVTFTGKLLPESINELLKKTDIYLQYSLQEGFCNAVLEAQAMGKLCIVSDAEGLTENIIDGVTGFVVEKRKPKFLTDTIIKVLAMDFERKEVVKRMAVERIVKEFSIEKQREEFISFYNF